jgi:hypothetical protein
MNHLRYANAALAALLALSVPLTASAAVLEYRFKASIVGMFESNAESGIIYVSSSAFAGDTISIGDEVSGGFSYNTDGVLSPGYQPIQPETGSYLFYTMDPLRSGLWFKIGGSAVGFTSGPNAGSLLLGNDNSNLFGFDTFNLNFEGEYDPVMLRLAGVSLYDFTGIAFSSGAIPEYLDFTAFIAKGVGGSWLRRSDGSQMQFQANISSIEAIESTVALPSTLLLLAFGFGVFLGFGSRGTGH